MARTARSDFKRPRLRWPRRNSSRRLRRRALGVFGCIKSSQKFPRAALLLARPRAGRASSADSYLPRLPTPASIANLLRRHPLRHVRIATVGVYVRLAGPVPRLPIAPGRIGGVGLRVDSEEKGT